MRTLFAFCLMLLVIPATARSQNGSRNEIDELLAPAQSWPGVFGFDIGITTNGAKLRALITAADLDPHRKQTRILLIETATAADFEYSSLQAMEWFYTSQEAAGYRKRFALSAVPLADSAGKVVAESSYPPTGAYYHGPEHAAAQYLWRWLGMHAADLVVLAEPAGEAAIRVPQSELDQLQSIPADAKLPMGDDLVSQLANGKACGVGAIAAVQIGGPGEALIDKLRTIMDSGFRDPSPARRELQRRAARSPLQVSRELSLHYGDQLNSVVYIPAVALIARLHLGELTGDADQLARVEKLAAPYAAGNKTSLPANASGSHLSGHLIFTELARRTGEAGYIRLAQQAADQGFTAAGEPRDSMPSHHEMSDAVFMGCPILVQTGKLTGQTKYYDMALRHFRFMQQLCLRDDGLYRHSPLHETAWGRGNGFPALGLALCLSDLSPDHPAHAELLAAFRNHMAALAKHQDPSGMWHQVIDHPSSYREFSGTCMITFAMLRGLQHGWLEPETYTAHVDRAWPAILIRIASDGTLVDVCTGTGKQQSLQAYLDRTAILGRDDRGGAMAFLVATEMEAYRRSTAAEKK